MCSLQLKQALAEILSQQGAVTPQRVRFFRGQMQTIISRALTDLDIKPVPSRRCFALIGQFDSPLVSPQSAVLQMQSRGVHSPLEELWAIQYLARSALSPYRLPATTCTPGSSPLERDPACAYCSLQSGGDVLKLHAQEVLECFLSPVQVC